MDFRSAVIIALQLVAVVRSEYGVLEANNGSETKSFCIYIFPNTLPLPQSKASAVRLPFLNLNSTWNGCNKDLPPESLTGKVVAMNVLNCSILEKAKSVERHGGVGVIIVSSGAPSTKSNDSYAEINITITAIGNNSASKLSKMGKNVKIAQFVEVDSAVDYSLLLIWALAMVTLTAGSFWSGHVKYHLSQRKKEILSGVPAVTDAAKSASSGHEEEDSLRVTPWIVLIFVSCMSGMLVMLYFFYDYLVYVIIAMFCVASALGLYQCLEPILPKLLPFANGRVRRLRVLCVTCRPQPKQIALALVSIAIPIWWVLVRKESYAWIIQDILGVAFSINMLKIMRLPNLKICTVLMVLLFFYDIFFVFVTPLFTKNGESVMVEVATGGSSLEQLPMVLKVPHFGNDPMTVCYNTRYSLLGFGDILVPGLLISYCLSFDLEVKSGKIYFISTVVAYGLGLVMTFGALYLMTAAQPALLYLVPCTLLTVFVIGGWRKELRNMWNGYSVEPVDEAKSSGNQRVDEPVESNTDTASEFGEESSLVR